MTGRRVDVIRMGRAAASVAGGSEENLEGPVSERVTVRQRPGERKCQRQMRRQESQEKEETGPSRFSRVWRAEKRIGHPVRFFRSGRCGIMLDWDVDTALNVCRWAPGPRVGWGSPVRAVQSDGRLSAAASP